MLTKLRTRQSARAAQLQQMALQPRASGICHRRTQRNMAVTAGLNGRMEKRLPVAVVVHLGDVQDHPVNAAELTYTENVSAHGACVISKRAWQPGEPAQVTSFKEQVALRGKVVHCRKYNDRYAVGLTFEGCEVTWETYRNYVSS